MASHSQSSSLDGYDYYAYSHSPSSSLTNNSYPPPTTTSSRHSGQTSQAPSIRKQASLAQISPPSFAAFRSQVSSIPISSPSALKRKPAPLLAPLSSSSPRPASLSLAGQVSPRLAEPASRPLSLDSPAPQQPSGLANALTPPLTEESASRQEDRSSFTFPRASHDRNDSIDSRIAATDPSSSVYGGDSRRSSIPIHARYAQEHTISHAPKPSISSIDSASHYSPAQRQSVGSTNGVESTPTMRLQIDGVQRTRSDESLNSESSRPRSPHSRLGNFFGWKSSSQKSPGGADSPTTSFSGRSQSPGGDGLPSPSMTKPLPMDMSGARLAPAGLDIHKANANHHYFDNPDTPILIGSPETNAHVKELERELEHISSELAGSIRREMELEDEIERMRVEIPSMPASEMGRRSSDYFSDSGASSTRFPITDPESKIEQMEQKLRKVEQEKAQTKNEMASRLQTELSRRADLEQMVQNMEEQLQKKFDEEDERGDMWERVEELESTLDDARRLLSQERQAKDSFEDLYSATREELESDRNELENLREEVVPRLRARVEGLEVEAANGQAVVYENTRMQQELVSLKERLALGGQFGMIAEEPHDGVSPINGPRSGLARSGSIARTRSMRGGSLTRSGSVKDREGGGSGRVRSGSLTKLTEEGLREIEDQRDALHKALKLLISRYDKQQKEHERAVRKLTSAKDLAEHATPKRSLYHKEVSFLKEEVTTLRKRTEDALEAKWQYEKGLSGIKMDLDRAELETRELRGLLQENDVFAPSPRTLLGDSAHWAEGGDGEDGKLTLSISTAESERDQARQLAEEYRQRASSTQKSPATSAELMTSAKRMDELADELHRHVASHVRLRERLTQAVTTGEREHMESSGKIEAMQKRLAGMEDSVLAAQQHSETTLGNSEAEVRRLEEASSPLLRRRLVVDIPVLDPGRLSPRMVKSPRLLLSPSASVGGKDGGGRRRMVVDTSLLEMSRTQMLERKVRELEVLLREAESDVQEVVQRVQRSQLEVADLQMERDAALVQMRKLQGLIVEERERAEGFLP